MRHEARLTKILSDTVLYMERYYMLLHQGVPEPDTVLSRHGGKKTRKTNKSKKTSKMRRRRGRRMH